MGRRRGRALAAAAVGRRPSPCWARSPTRCRSDRPSGVQFANNFTGLVGRHRRHHAVVIRFFQRQGLGAGGGGQLGRAQHPGGHGGASSSSSPSRWCSPGATSPRRPPRPRRRASTGIERAPRLVIALVIAVGVGVGAVAAGAHAAPPGRRARSSRSSWPRVRTCARHRAQPPQGASSCSAATSSRRCCSPSTLEAALHAVRPVAAAAAS